MKTITLEQERRLRDADILRVLDFLCQQVELSDTQKKDAEEKYYAIGNWLNDVGSSLRRFDPRIYVQGSKRTGTTVKPQGQQEHDLDLVCQYMVIPSMDPKVIKQLAWDRLGEHGYYRKIREEKNRCIRLNYAGEFHMDIMPCIPDASRAGWAVLVPDKKLAGLKESNPRDFGVWFDEKALIIPVFTRDFEVYTDNVKAAAVDPLPEDDPFHKEPLRRFVQLLKVHRDRYFGDDHELAPISIIITTLIARSYAEVAGLGPHDSILDLLESVVANLDDHVVCVPHPGGGVDYLVTNPTNDQENFAERWCDDPSLYEHFLRWQTACREFIRGLRDQYGDGGSMEKFGSYIGNSVDEDLAKRAIGAFARKRHETTERGDSYMHSTGIITSGSVLAGSQKMPRHTNFGSA